MILPKKSLELDEYLGDIHGLIVGKFRIICIQIMHNNNFILKIDREIEIMQKLQDHILEYASLLLNATAVCAELDW